VACCHDHGSEPLSCIIYGRFHFVPIARTNRQMPFLGTVLKLSTLNTLTWKIWRAPNNASRWQMGFNSAFKGLTQLVAIIMHV